MQYDTFVQRLRARVDEGADIQISCDQLFELHGMSWSDLQSHFDSGRFVLRGMPGSLRKIDQNIHPWVFNVLSALIIAVPIITGIIVHSWWMVLMFLLSWVGMFLGSRSCLGNLMYVTLVPLTVWAVYSGRPIIGACVGGLLLGAVGASFVGSFGRVFGALRTNEVLFSCFFGFGMIWIEDQVTGDQLRAQPK